MSAKHTTQPRKPKGLPVGGQWTTQELAGAGISLLGHRPLSEDLLAQRREQLQEQGYVPSVSTQAVASPETTANRGQWWDSHFIQAEYDSGGGYAQMPDDYTPSQTSGRAMSGRRRTHRMAYTTGGVALRMPSRTAINRFAAETKGDTFDVPVAASLPSGDVQTWVRLTRHGPGQWEATALGMDGDGRASERIGLSEAVAATMEGRAAALKPQSFGDLIERRKKKIAESGFTMDQVRSGWISSVGYDSAAGVMGTMTTDGRVYGHQVSKATFDAVRQAHSPGRAFNKIVKGHGRAGVEQCPECGRFKAEGAAHTCPAGHKDPRTSADPQAVRARARALGLVTAPHQRHASAGRDYQAGQSHRDPTEPTGPVHVRDENEQRIDLASVLGTQDSAYVEPGRVTDHGAERGWTARVLPATLGPHTSSTYAPDEYRLTGTNGSMGLVSYAGVGSDTAAQLLADCPQDALMQERQNDAPRVSTMLQAAVAHPGRVELGGYVVGSERSDERLSADTAYIFGEADTDPSEVLVKAKNTYGLTDALRRPDNLDLVQVPWRPGEKAWRLWWD